MKKQANAAAELGGLGILAVPSIDHLQAAARARLAGDRTPGGVEKRRFMGDTAGHAMEVGGLGVLAAPEISKLRAASKLIPKHAMAAMSDELVAITRSR